MQVGKLVFIGLQLLALLTVGCQSTASTSTERGNQPLTIFAASSLTGAFGEIGKAFESATPGTQAVFSFAGSQELRTAIEHGAKADVFASADARNMELLKAQGLVQPDGPVFATNRLVVIVNKSNPAGVKQLQDLAKPNLKLDLADASVPVGNYTLQVLDRLAADPSFGADFKAQVLDRAVSKEMNVKQVVSKVSLGEADAGIVYSSDAQAVQERAGNLIVLDIPDPFNVVAAYPIAVVKASTQPALANKFVQFVLSTQGQTILKKHGLAAPQ